MDNRSVKMLDRSQLVAEQEGPWKSSLCVNADNEMTIVFNPNMT